MNKPVTAWAIESHLRVLQESLAVAKYGLEFIARSWATTPAGIHANALVQTIQALEEGATITEVEK